MTRSQNALRVYLIDDESLALKRLTRLLQQSGRTEVVGSSMNPKEGLAYLSAHTVDALFLDIQMPEMTGFELLANLDRPPLVVFTTAFDRYALNAFEVNSIDYLLKPIEAERLQRALTKLERLLGTPEAALQGDQIRAMLSALTRKFPERIPSRIGERVVFVDVGKITHVYAKDKLTYAATTSRDYVLDGAVNDVEQMLDPAQFVRIHRATLLNINYVDEVSTWFGGKLIVRLKDPKHTELQVARDRVSALKNRLNF